MDTVSPEIRSRVMAKVRSHRNRSTEWRLRSALVRVGIRGWTLNMADLIGKPDFVFPIQRLVMFVDGCFWHGWPDAGAFRVLMSRIGNGRLGVIELGIGL